MVSSNQSENNSTLCSYYPNAGKLRYPCFFKNCGLSFKARWLWSFLLYASRHNKGYGLRHLERLSGLDHKTISKLLSGELAAWVKKKKRIYARQPPPGMVKECQDYGSWQQRLASVKLLVPLSKRIKPLEAVILAVLGSQDKTQGDVIRICAIAKNTFVSHKRRLVELGLLADDLELTPPTEEQQSWFRPMKNKKPPTYNI